MKEININCILRNAFFPYRYYRIYIYHNNDLVFESLTNYYGILKLNMLNHHEYTIIVLANDDIFPTICKADVFINGSFNTINFYFKENHNVPVNMIVTDKYYPGLPIKKGEIKLCQTM